MTQLIPDVRQKHLVSFEESLGGIDGLSEVIGLKGTRANNEICLAAIKAEWFTNGFDAKALGNLTGVEARDLAGAILDAYQEATTIDPN